jgi:hypothetical protein
VSWTSALSAGAKGAELGDFMPIWDTAEQEERKPKQTPEQMIAVIRGLQAGRRKKKWKERSEQP